jgi:hypothetical protein
MDNRHNNHTSYNESKEQTVQGAFPNPGDQSLLIHASLNALPGASLRPLAQASPQQPVNPFPQDSLPISSAQESDRSFSCDQEEAKDTPHSRKRNLTPNSMYHEPDTAPASERQKRSNGLKVIVNHVESLRRNLKITQESLLLSQRQTAVAEEKLSQCNVTIESLKQQIMDKKDELCQQEIESKEEHRTKLNKKLLDARLEKENTIHFLKLKFEKQIEDAQAKSSQHTKNLTRIDGLERQVKDLEKKNLELVMVRAVAAKQAQHLKTESEQRKEYEAAWLQSQSELKALEIEHINTRVELEELKAAADAAKDTTQNAPAPAVSHASPPTSSQPRGIIPSTLQRLDIEEERCELLLKAKKESNEEKEAEIASLNTEIDNCIQLLNQDPPLAHRFLLIPILLRSSL